MQVEINHPNAKAIAAFFNGKRNVHTKQWSYLARPVFADDQQYRVQPKPLIKKWRQVFCTYEGELRITGLYFESEADLNSKYVSLQAVQKIDSTMIEVEEE